MYKMFIIFALSLLAMAIWWLCGDAHKAKIDKQLAHLSDVVGRKDKAAILAAIDASLLPDATFDLRFTAVTLGQNPPPDRQEHYERQEFMNLVSTTLDTLTDDAFSANVERLTMDGKSQGAVTLSGRIRGDGTSDYSGTSISMRFNADVACDAHVDLTSPTPRFGAVRCTLRILSLPMAGQQDKLRGDPAMIQELLR